MFYYVVLSSFTSASFYDEYYHRENTPLSKGEQFFPQKLYCRMHNIVLFPN